MLASLPFKKLLLFVHQAWFETGPTNSLNGLALPPQVLWLWMVALVASRCLSLFKDGLIVKDEQLFIPS